MALNVETFVKEIESMSVLELNGLVKALEEKFGVSAAMMAAPAAAAGAAPAAAAAEEQTEFTVVLKEAGSNKINVIKAVREVNSSLGLKEAKDLVENLGTVKEGISKDEAAAEEQTEFTVVLKEAGSNKINVIKAVREVNSSLGLKEAKDLADGFDDV